MIDYNKPACPYGCGEHYYIFPKWHFCKGQPAIIKMKEEETKKKD